MRTLLALLSAGLCSTWSQAQANTGPQISGFVKPSLSVKYRPVAVPASQFQVGFEEAKAGLRLEEEGRRLDYHLYLYLTGETVEVLTRAIPLDTDNDGNADKIFTLDTKAAKNLLREAWVNWNFTEGIKLKMGRMAVPFTSQAQAPDTELMFPNRASPNAVFLGQRDIGALVKLTPQSERASLQAGIFNGTGSAVGEVSQTGILYALRLDLAPLGPFSAVETGATQDPWKIGWGLGFVIRPYTLYDGSGYPSSGVVDMRATTSFRVTGRNLHFLAEALARYATDTLTDRPLIDYGAFGQVGYYTRLGVEPVFRLGWVNEDTSFSPQQIYWGEAGANFYLPEENAETKPARLGIHYTNEYRYTEREMAHGASAQLLVYF